MPGQNARLGLMIAGAAVVVWGFVAAGSIASDWKDNEDRTSGAPQQQVVATWAVKDAALVGLRILAVVGGVVIVGLGVLVNRRPEDDEAAEDARLATGLWQRCPACFDVVRAGARVCKSCRSDLEADDDNELPEATAEDVS